MKDISRAFIPERIPKAIYNLQIFATKNEGLGIVRVVLLNSGLEDKDLVASFLRGRETIELFDANKHKLEKIKKLFGRLRLEGVKTRLRCLAPKDWLTRWKRQWKPAALTRKIDVVPVWCSKSYKLRPGRDLILMDTLLSFGTGLHETTRIMAQFIENKKGKFSSFLDIGTGTGILGFVAQKNGAQDIIGIDIGALSVQAAKSNMQANRSYFKVVQADIRKFKINKVFDFVAANLVTEDLIKNVCKIFSFVKKGGYLAVSGISLENLPRLRKEFSKHPLKCLKINRGKQWTGLLFQKKTL